MCGTLARMAVGRTAPIILRASAVLTNAFVTSVAKVVPRGVRRVSIKFTYTRGAAGGYPSIFVLVDDANPPPSPIGIAQGTATQTNEVIATPMGQWEFQPFGATGPAGAGAASVTIPIVLTAGTYIAVSCEETGQKGTPGTLAISMIGDVEV